MSACCISSLIAGLVPNGNGIPFAKGILYGTAMTLAGLAMICTMVSRIDASTTKGQGFSGYMLRFALYGFCLWMGLKWKLPVLAMMAGILIQKASLLIYTYLHRKDS